MKRNLHERCSREGKLMAMERTETAMDEQLAALGYKVRSSDMANVAKKLEQLDMAMSSNSAQDDAMLSHLSFDTVHYNPSDISNWLENMLSELNAPVIPMNTVGNMISPFTNTVESEGKSRNRKRMKISSIPPVSSSDSVVMIAADSQEAGIRLVHALLACAESVQQEDYKTAATILKQISILASSQIGAMRKVSGYFAEALARRIYHHNPNQDSYLESAFSDILEMHFYESCPYLKFAHFTANQAILEAFSGCERVHVIDFGIKQGMQWPALMQALALRPGGPPSFRLTGIGSPSANNSDELHQLGLKLAQLAQSIHIDFEYRALIAKNLAEIEPFLLQPNESETLAINSIFELHNLLAQPSSLQKLLSTIRSLRPAIITIVEQEANHNSGGFLIRFTESLHYYSAMFDSLEEVARGEDRTMSEVYLGRQICNVVACEGAGRTERHEVFSQWKLRMESAGFGMVNVGSNAFKQASMLLALFAGGEGFRVEERGGCLTLGWHTRPLIVSSGWCVDGGGGGAGGGGGSGEAELRG